MLAWPRCFPTSGRAQRCLDSPTQEADRPLCLLCPLLAPQRREFHVLGDGPLLFLERGCAPAWRAVAEIAGETDQEHQVERPLPQPTRSIHPQVGEGLQRREGIGLLGREDQRRHITDVGEQQSQDGEGSRNTPAQATDGDAHPIPRADQLSVYPDGLRTGPGVHQPGRRDQEHAIGQQRPQSDPRDRLESPYDPEARFATKRSTVWRGYEVHLTETCDADGPHLITDVQTTPAPLPDVAMTQPIEQALFERELLPAEHFVDAGYTEADWLVGSQRQRGLRVVGPVRTNGSWQARDAQGYDVTQFQLDWQRQQAICPQGQRSHSWTPYHDRAGTPVISVKFSRPVCQRCPVRTHCTHSARRARQLTVRVEADYAALVRLRAEQETPEWKALYHRRAGVEGTFAQGVRLMGLRRARYVGSAKVHLQQLVIAVALNLVRLANWLANVPFATTRHSRFAQLGLAS